MPLTINVGLSRKASRNYQSTGISINVTAELDQTLLTRPADLQRQIASLYAQAQQALDQRSAAHAAATPPQEASAASEPETAPANGNGGHTAIAQPAASGDRMNGNGDAPRITASQGRAILAIASAHAADPRIMARRLFGSNLEALSRRQASELIDHLRSHGAATASVPPARRPG